MPTLRRGNSKKFQYKNHTAVLAGKNTLHKMKRVRLQSGKKYNIQNEKRAAYKAVKNIAIYKMAKEAVYKAVKIAIYKMAKDRLQRGKIYKQKRYAEKYTRC